MSGMDRLTDDKLKRMADGLFNALEMQLLDDLGSMARELLAHRRASQSAPAPVGDSITDDTAAIKALQRKPSSPAPSDGLREENERLRSHIRTMQGYIQEYLEPGPYVQKHGDQKGRRLLEWADKTPNIVQESQNEMRAAVLNDLIHMLDGPEERAALTPAPAQEGERPAKPVCPICKGHSRFDQCSCHYEARHD